MTANTQTTKKARAPRKATKKAAKTAKTTKAPTATKPAKAAKPKRPAKEPAPRPPRERDPRLPSPGTTIVRPYKGKDINVTVLEDGFRWEGKEYRSLSALAAAITGAKAINGFFWFRLTEKKATTTAAAPTDEASRAE